MGGLSRWEPSNPRIRGFGVLLEKDLREAAFQGALVKDEKSLANFFKAIAHPTRISILKTIRSQPFCVNDISSRLKLNQPNTSQHLAILSKRNILEKTRKGTEVCYRVKDPAVMRIVEAAEKLLKKLGEGGRGARGGVRVKSPRAVKKSPAK
jgi:DNA-binding transcriptional ArsR family regulator